MNIYIAGRYSRRDELRQVRDKLLKRGHTVTSRWLDENTCLQENLDDHPSDRHKRVANIDLMDVIRANSLLFFSEDPKVGTPRGGRHVEFGYALALGKPIHVIGPQENVFHFLHEVKHYNSLEDFLATN